MKSQKERFSFINIKIGKNLQQFRKEAGLSQSKLAEKIDCSFQQLQKYEWGTNRISAALLYDLSLIFKCRVGEFYVGVVPTDVGVRDE